MAVIQTYNDSIAPSGQLNVQATPNAFGANVGQAVQQLGEAGQQYAERQYQQEVQDDLTSVYKDMAAARSKFTADLEQAYTQSSPGDQTLAPRMINAMQEHFDELGQKYTTRAGQREFARLSADLTSAFASRAVERQAVLAAQGAVNDHNQQITSLGQAVFNDPTQLEGTIKQLKTSIDNPEGIYARVPQTERDKLKLNGEQDLRMSAVMSQIQRNPEQFLAKISPDTLQKFRQTDRVASALNSSAPQTNTRVYSLQPIIQQNAEKYGVDPNIMTAQIMQESGGDTKVVSAKGAKGVSQFMDDTAKQYGVDVTDDASSIRGQANMMSDLLQQYGGDYQKALAAYNWGSGNLNKALDKYGENWMQNAPQETRDYVSKILGDAGIQAVTGQPVIPSGGKPVSLGDKNFDLLPWEKQYQVIQTAQMQVRANQVHDQQKIAFAEQARVKAQESELNAMLPKLENNELNPQDVLNSTSLDFQHKNYMLNAIRAKSNKLDDTDPKVLVDVIGRIQRGELTDPSSLYDYVGHGLSLPDVKRAQDIVNGKGTALGAMRQTFLNTAKSQITGTQAAAGIQDPEGDKQYLSFFQEYNQIVSEKQKAGVPLSEMISNQQSKEYLGWLVKKYTRSTTERIKAMADTVRNSSATAEPGAAPRQPGETVDQYMLPQGIK